MSMTRRATNSTGQQTQAAKTQRRVTVRRQSEADMRREIAELEARIDRDLALLADQTDRLMAKILP